MSIKETECRKEDVIKTIKDPILPTTNICTDGFGFERFWGLHNDWNPNVLYSPIHLGRDFRSYPERHILAPFNGMVYGMMIPEVSKIIGSCLMFIPKKNEIEPSENIALYFIHCNIKAADMYKWKNVKKGEVIAAQGSFGTSAAHLHLSCCISEYAFKQLANKCIFKDKEIDIEKTVNTKASQSGLNEKKCLTRVKRTMRQWKVLSIGEGWIKKNQCPEYKMSKFLNIPSKGISYEVDPGIILNSLHIMDIPF